MSLFLTILDNLTVFFILGGLFSWDILRCNGFPMGKKSKDRQDRVRFPSRKPSVVQPAEAGDKRLVASVGVVAALVAVLGGGFFLTRSNSQQSQRQNISDPSREVVITIQPPEMIVDESISIPKMTFLDIPYHFTKPEHLDMTEAEFQATSRLLTPMIQDAFTRVFKPAMEKHPNGDTLIVANFLLQVFEGLKKLGQPKVLAHLHAAKLPEGTMGTSELVAFMNVYLQPQGFCAQLGDDALSNQKTLNLYRISKTTQAVIEDTKGKFTFPLLHLSQPLLPEAMHSGLGFDIARADRTFLCMLVFEDHIDRVTDYYYEPGHMPSYPRFQQLPPKEIFRDNFLSESLAHELAHLLLYRRFPQSSGGDNKTVYPITVRFRFQGKEQEQTVEMTTSMLHEGAAAGYQLAQSQLQTPITHLGFFQPTAPEYRAIPFPLLLSSLQAVPSSPAKDLILDAMANQRGTDRETIASMIGVTNSTVTETNSSGQALWRHFYAQFGEIESGRLKPRGEASK